MGPLTKPSITNYKTYNLDYKYYGIIQSIRPCTNHYVKPLKTSKNDPKIDLYKRDVCAVKYLDGPDEGHGHPLLELVDRGVQVQHLHDLRGKGRERQRHYDVGEGSASMDSPDS